MSLRQMTEEPEGYAMDLVRDILRGMDVRSEEFPSKTTDTFPPVGAEGNRCIARLLELGLIEGGKEIRQTEGSGTLHWATYQPRPAA